MTHGIVSLSVKCDYPLWMQYSLIFYMISFLVLFSNFYLYSYAMRQRKENKQKEEFVVNGNANVVEHEKENKKRA